MALISSIFNYLTVRIVTIGDYNTPNQPASRITPPPPIHQHQARAKNSSYSLLYVCALIAHPNPVSWEIEAGQVSRTEAIRKKEKKGQRKGRGRGRGRGKKSKYSKGKTGGKKEVEAKKEK